MGKWEKYKRRYKIEWQKKDIFRDKLMMSANINKITFRTTCFSVLDLHNMLYIYA